MIPNTKIIIENGKTEVYINGEKVEYLRCIELTARFDEMPIIKIEMFPPGSIPELKCLKQY